MERFSNIEHVVDKEDIEHDVHKSGLDNLPDSEKVLKQKKKAALFSEGVIEPMNALHVLRLESREAELPEAPKVKADIPVIPDLKKADEDYNSVDYQIIAFNLWKAKAKENF